MTPKEKKDCEKLLSFKLDDEVLNNENLVKLDLTPPQMTFKSLTKILLKEKEQDLKFNEISESKCTNSITFQ